MHKTIWKYILNAKEGRELGFLCQNFTIQIPGFRNKVVPKNMDRKLVSLIFQPNNLKKLTIDKNVAHRDEYYVDEIILETDLDELKKLATTKYPPSRVLEVLLINKKYEEANRLFIFLNNRYNEHELYLLEKELKNKPEEKLKKESEVIRTDNLLEATESRVMKKLIEKISNLKDEIDKAHKETKRIKKEYANERNIKNSEIDKLRMKNGCLQKEIFNLNEELHGLKKELLDIKEREQSVVKAMQELENENKSLKQAIISEGNTKQRLPNITIVGKPSNSLIDSCEINFDIVDKSDVLEIDLTNQAEVWILTYQVDKKIRRELIQAGFENPILLIRTFLELKKTIQRRLKSYV